MAVAGGEDAPRPRGRRPDPAKRQAIMTAAREEFFEQGYAASMDAIAHRAGVSKQTIYNAFATKEELFAEMVAEVSAQIIAPLADHSPDSTPAEVLTAFARQYLQVIEAPRSIAMIRTLTAQASQFPELIAAFYRTGPANNLAHLAAYLAEETARGRLAASDPVMAAEQFFGMLTGSKHLRNLLGIDPPATAEQQERRITAGVAAFLRAHGTAG